MARDPQQLQLDLEHAFAELDGKITSNGDDREYDAELLRSAWIREQYVDDILPYEEDLIERILARVQTQLQYLELHSAMEEANKLQLVILETELERIQFLLRSYIRLRLLKIDRYAIYIQTEPVVLQNLSQTEAEYMKKHLELLSELLHDSCLSKLPPSLRSLSEPEMVTRPDMTKPVFLMCKSDTAVDIGGEGEDSILEMKVGEVYVIRYQYIRHLLERDDVVIV
ncbi:DNA replication protein [Martiniozyma asiatica (nom. inval.)]|nr:DNA replication protein [Martiniozyma asiatica]